MSPPAGPSARALVWRREALSLRVPRRMLRACLGLGAALLLACVLSLSLGDYPLSLPEVWAALRGEGEGAFVVRTLRAPRLLTGACAGACLGLSGAIFQSLARNPLAAPDVIGFTQGAGLGAVAVIGLTDLGSLWMTLGSVGGGLGAALLVGLLSWKDGLRIWRLVLVGIGVGYALYALIDFAMTRTDRFGATAATQWLAGSLNARLWSHAGMAAAGLALLAPLALGLERALDRLEMGDDAAVALGLRVGAVRLGAAVVAVLLCAVAVSVTGPVAFVAFVAGPLGRRLAGTGGAALLPAALVGALLLVLADLAARTAFAPTQLPAGLFTAGIGAPYLLWLLAAQVRRGSL